MSEAEYFQQFMGDVPYYVTRSNKGIAIHGWHLNLNDALDCARSRTNQYDRLTVALQLNYPSGDVLWEAPYHG